MDDRCPSCHTDLRAGARFCDSCGSSVEASPAVAEYKQVTVMFADVVRSMDVAAAVGPERLRDIMAEIFDRCAAVVNRYGGTVDKFTGDGVMAVFGAPRALEDHALRACMAALGIQQEMRLVAAEVEKHDGVTLALRVGLNSGEVIAGEIGSQAPSYTSVGEQVGMAQRMESAAPPGGIILSESTARLVDADAELGEPEKVRIKGSEVPVLARQLLAVRPRRLYGRRQLSTLVGRTWEVDAITALLDQSIGGSGRVIGLVGPPGIGKTRLVEEISVRAADRGVETFFAFAESHTSEVPFHVVSGLLRNIFGVDGVTDDCAGEAIRDRMRGADAEDLVLLDDLLGIRADGQALPAIDPSARRRRLTALLNTAATARVDPAVFVIEDVHWIDDASEQMIHDFAAVVPQTRALVILTYRPEYAGSLDRLPRSQRIALEPLDDAYCAALATELLGPDPLVASLVAQVARRAAGNPYFVEEMVRDLAERGVVGGRAGAFFLRQDSSTIRVPASLQATIAARIDRLGAAAKSTLNAASVIGMKFDSDLLASLAGSVQIDELTSAELVDRVSFGEVDEYVFRHPLVRAVAYESQLKSERARLHEAVAAAIEIRNPSAADANAALIAEHREAAGDLRGALEWHMRAGGWSQFRDVAAANASWLRARDVADRLPADDPDRTALRIMPRTLLCANCWRFNAKPEETGFDELRELCLPVGDGLSLCIGMAGTLTAYLFHGRYDEAARLAAECAALAAQIADRAAAIDIIAAAGNALMQAGRATEALRLAEIAVSDGDLGVEHGRILDSPAVLALGLRAVSKCMLGIAGWRDDFEASIKRARSADATAYATALLYKYAVAMRVGALKSDNAGVVETAEALERAERFGDNFAREAALITRCTVLINQEGELREEGLRLLAQYREPTFREHAMRWGIRVASIEEAHQTMLSGDLGTAIKQARHCVDQLFASGEMMSRGFATTTLVESLLQRGTDSDVEEAAAAIERLAAVPVDPGFVLHELPLFRMRALLAQARGDDRGYRRYADRYRTMANELGFDGHMAIAASM